MSVAVVRCRYRWLLAAACSVVLCACAGPSTQRRDLDGAKPLRTPGARAQFTLPAGATIVDLNHTTADGASSWVDTDLRAARRAMRGAPSREIGFTMAEGSVAPRGFGADRNSTPTTADALQEEGRSPRLRRLVAHLVVIDMCDRAASNRDAELRLEDLEAFEHFHGDIAAGSAVLVRTCWYWRWANRASYLGTDSIASARFHFPGLSWRAARALIDREVAAVAIDTAGVDHGPSTGDVVRRTLEQAQIAVFVNVVAYQDLPARGALFLALPMKIPGSSRTPMRVLALTP